MYGGRSHTRGGRSHLRRSRYRRGGSYLSNRTTGWRLGTLWIVSLLAILLSLLMTKQPGIAQSLRPLANQPPFFQSFMMAVGRAFQVAQVPEPTQIVQQGTQVVLNGTSYTVAWSQQQDGRIGITDTGIVQTIGVDLLSTNDAQTQPIEWFSDQRVTPIALSAWHIGPNRYVDVADLVSRFGWQVEVNGSTLQISTPAANVSGIRQGRQSWGDRIVVDVDQAVPWQVSEQPGETTITIDAQINPALVQAFRSSAGNRITSLNVAKNGNRTVIRVGTARTIRPRVWTIPDPNRLLIDVRPDSLAERDILWNPGIRWRQQFVNLGGDRFPVVSLEIDPRQPGITLKPIVSNPSSVIGTAPLVTTAQQSQAVAAINGGFFNRNNQLPLGAIRRDDKWVSGPILNRGAIAWDNAGGVAVGRLNLQETLITSTGQRLPVVYLNSGYVGTGVYRHTQDWGATYSSILDDEDVLVVQNNQVTAQQHINKAGQAAVSIPTDGYLLVIRGDRTALNALPIGTTIEIEALTQPTDFSRYPQVVGAGPLLLQDRQVVLNTQAEQFSEAFRQQAASRSVIGTTAEGTLMLLTVHNRVDGQGPTLAETARLMQQLGMVNALNLDGGSSTSLYLGGKLLDRVPSSAARVHNGIGVFVQSDQ